MGDIIFLFILAFVWIVFAVFHDLKTKEIPNWLNFSLAAFALGFRLFYSLFSGGDFSFFFQGVIGLGIFFALGNALYYGKIFAGGDAKLMIALGTVLPVYGIFLDNLKIFVVFFLMFMFIGAIYGLFFSFALSLKNFKAFKREFFRQLKKNRKRVYSVMALGLALIIAGLFEELLFIWGAVVFVFPYFYLYSKAVDEACMTKEIKTSKLTEGDWLYRDTKVIKRVVKASWEGLNKKDIKELKKRYKKVKIRQGVAFSPVFLISFIVLLVFYFLNIDLRNPFW
jgi:Flp pilus assembly protein protease CpaA